VKKYIPSPSNNVAEHVELYESSGGTKGATRHGLPCILVTSVGRRTGGLRKTPLMRVKDGKNYILVASQGGAPQNPYWYYNLKADPNVLIRDGIHVYTMKVRQVIDPVEKARVWNVAVEIFPPYQQYQMKTERVIPVFLAEHEPPD
jgi:deazaflavin-dependent oxidoreductase (nitroreductase family)